MERGRDRARDRERDSKKKEEKEKREGEGEREREREMHTHTDLQRACRKHAQLDNRLVAAEQELAVQINVSPVRIQRGPIHQI